MTKTPITYHLKIVDKSSDIKKCFNKIIDYFLTFVGDIEVKKENNSEAIVYYLQTPITARLKTENNDQITVTTSEEDTVTINLIKNVAGNIGLRIYNPQTNSYILSSVNIDDLTTFKVDPKVKQIFKEYHLTPLFQYRGSLIFFAKDKEEKIHFINRHLLEHLMNHEEKKLYPKEFSVEVASSIGKFVALFDRGLIPLSFYKFKNGNSKIINLSGLNIDKLYSDCVVFPVYFNFDKENQNFIQNENTPLPNKIEIKKHGSIIKRLSSTIKGSKIEYAVIKIAGDISFEKIKDKLIPKISISVFLN